MKGQGRSCRCPLTLALEWALPFCSTLADKPPCDFEAVRLNREFTRHRLVSRRRFAAKEIAKLLPLQTKSFLRAIKGAKPLPKLSLHVFFVHFGLRHVR